MLVIRALDMMDADRQQLGSTPRTAEGSSLNDRLVPAKNFLKSRFSSLMNKTREQMSKYTLN